MAITVNEAIEKMTSKGYQSVSQSISGIKDIAVNFIKPIQDGITVQAKVLLKSETVELSFLGLDYLCKLVTGPVPIDGTNFAKYEGVLAVYVAKITDQDVFEVLKEFKLKSKGVPEVPVKKDLQTRKDEFWDKIRTVGKEKGYEKKMCLAFFNYWNEANEGGRKMRFEMQKIFDVARRLNTWIQKEAEFKPAWKAKEEKKIEKQEESITAWKPVTKHADLFN